MDDAIVNPSSRFPFKLFNFAAIPSEWKEWGSWSQCTSSCGDGMKVRIRGCPSQPAFACNGHPTETAPCSSGYSLKVKQARFFFTRNCKFPLSISSLQVLLVPGQSGANGPSATPLGSTARSSGFVTATMLLRLLPVMATQSRRLHAWSLLLINHLVKTSPVQVGFNP